MDDGARSPYHHGDLRAALVQTALDLVEESGVEALSLRQVARRAGVSRGAPYHHFRNKEAMIAAVAQHGFVQLTSCMAGAEAMAPRVAMRACGSGYLRFAQDNPTLYRLMFGTKVGDFHAHPALEAEAKAAFGILQGHLQRLQAAGEAPAGDPFSWSMAVWASVHGMALLLIDDLGPHDRSAGTPPPVDAWIDALLDLVEAGLLHRAQGVPTPPGPS